MKRKLAAAATSDANIAGVKLRKMEGIANGSREKNQYSSEGALGISRPYLACRISIACFYLYRSRIPVIFTQLVFHSKCDAEMRLANLQCISWVLRIGIAHSAGGARAPMCRLISDIARVYAMPGVVDLSRNRCWRPTCAKEELKEGYLANGRLGLVVKLDMAPMRLFLDKKSAPRQ